MEKYVFKIVEFRRVLLKSCSSIFNNKVVSDVVYTLICNDLEEFLDDCEVDDGTILK